MSRDVTVDGPGEYADLWRVVLRYRRLLFGWGWVRVFDPATGETITRFPFRGGRGAAQEWVAELMDEVVTGMRAAQWRVEENGQD